MRTDRPARDVPCLGCVRFVASAPTSSALTAGVGAPPGRPDGRAAALQLAHQDLLVDERERGKLQGDDSVPDQLPALSLRRINDTLSRV
jgi:hypothetical protein